MAIAEDFTYYLADFGVAATLDGAPVRVIHEAPVGAGSVGPFGMTEVRPTAGLPTAVLVGDPVGKVLQIGSTPYRVAEHSADGTGWSTLVLEASA
ncbi:head-tail joining protein [Acidovorax lacteus]|uniref:Head decoration protein n=1 Tax=Acidovorax lacteus TaxID=1924988 RepID=A0ABP8L0H1_9BURK